MLRDVLATLAAALAASLCVAADARLIQSSDLFRMVQVSDAEISPDGKTIAFLSPEGAPGTPLQIYLASRDGQAHKLTRMPADVQEIAWSPDSKSLAFVAADPPDEAEVQSRGGRFDAGEAGDTVHAAALPSQLWIVSVSGAKPVKLTTGPTSVSAADAYSSPAGHHTWLQIEKDF